MSTEFNKAPEGVPYKADNGIRIVKSRAILPNQNEKLLQTVDHLETQLGRLVKMAKEIRKEILSLTVEQ